VLSEASLNSRSGENKTKKDGFNSQGRRFELGSAGNRTRNEPVSYWFGC
jgi:hypothetical protein